MPGAKAAVSMASLIRPAYRPFAKLTDLLRSFLHVAIKATNSTQGKICLKDFAPSVGRPEGGVLIVGSDTSEPGSQGPFDKECTACAAFYERHRREPLIAYDVKTEAHCVRLRLPCGSSMAVPIWYQGTAIGVVALASNRTGHYLTPSAEAGQLMAREIAYQVKRYEFHEIARAKLGKDLRLVGTSEALRRVDEFIEKASQVDLPALIIGEFGTEKEPVVHALHFASPRREGPFVEVNCSAFDPPTFTSELSLRFRQADQGTIFFSGIDELEDKLQARLSEILESGIRQWMSQTKGEKPVDVRIVASASRDLEALVSGGRFCQSLLKVLDFLPVQIAPLRERKEDIRPLIEYFLRKYAGLQTRTISNEVIELCEAYPWPGNVCELEHVIARLAVMAEEETITMKDVSAHAPKLAQGLPASKREAIVGGSVTPRGVAKGKKGRRGKEIDSRLMHLANDLIEGEFTELREFHPNVQKALEYVAQNFQEAISLGQLARQACVSPSYLSCLFQHTLGVSFKTFLALVRIEKAKHLLVEKPYLRVTDLSGEVGFGDLRHFERTFRWLVGCAPREYRRKAPEQRKS